MVINRPILAILATYGIDPQQTLPCGNTAYSKLEAAIMAVCEEIEDTDQ